jgi:hypothetical protein
MDERVVLNGISFVWDQAKAQANLKKHGIAFEQAAEAFFDPFLRVMDASSKTQVRDAIIGMDSRWNLLFVVYVAFEDESIRLISARQSTRRERQLYEG